MQRTNEALRKEREERHQEREERDAVQKGIFDELQHLSDVQELQQKNIANVAGSTATLAKSSTELYPWQKWGTLMIIILSLLSLCIALFVGIRAGLVPTHLQVTMSGMAPSYVE